MQQCRIAIKWCIAEPQLAFSADHFNFNCTDTRHAGFFVARSPLTMLSLVPFVLRVEFASDYTGQQSFKYLEVISLD